MRIVEIMEENGFEGPMRGLCGEYEALRARVLERDGEAMDEYLKLFLRALERMNAYYYLLLSRRLKISVAPSPKTAEVFDRLVCREIRDVFATISGNFEGACMLADSTVPFSVEDSPFEEFRFLIRDFLLPGGVVVCRVVPHEGLWRLVFRRRRRGGPSVAEKCIILRYLPELVTRLFEFLLGFGRFRRAEMEKIVDLGASDDDQQDIG